MVIFWLTRILLPLRLTLALTSFGPTDFNSKLAPYHGYRFWISATRIFGEHLSHTPITAIGVNRTVHFKLPDMSSRIRLGRKLAPIEPWEDFGQGLDTDDVNQTGGLQSLTMRRKYLLEGGAIETNVTIEPSIRVEGNTAVYMHINAHHALANLPAGHGSEMAMSLLARRFEPALDEADAIIQNIMQKGKDNE